MNQAERDAEAKRRARAPRRSQAAADTGAPAVGASFVPAVSEPGAQSSMEPSAPVVTGAAAVAASNTTVQAVISQAEQDAISKRRARGGRMTTVGAVSVGAMSEPAPSAPAVDTSTMTQAEKDAHAKAQARSGVGAQGMGAPDVVMDSAPAVVMGSAPAPAVRPGVQSVSGDEARTLEDRIRQKEGRGARSAARAERRQNREPEPVIAPAPVMPRPGAVTVIASAALQSAPKVDTVSMSSTVGAVNTISPMTSEEDKKRLMKEMTPDEKAAEAAAERQRRVDEKMAAMDRQDELRDARRKDREEQRDAKQETAPTGRSVSIQANDKENEISNPTGHFAPHLLRGGMSTRVNDKSEGFNDKSEGLSPDPAQEQPLRSSSMQNDNGPIVTADHGAITAPEVIGGYFQAAPEVDDNELAVAIAIEEDEEEKFIAAAVEYDPDAKPPIYQNRRFRMYGFCGLCCVCLAVIVVIIIVFVMGGTDEITIRKVTRAPTLAPTLAPTTSTESIFRNFFASQVGEQVNVPGTPHDMAARWIMFDDPMKLAPDAENLLQRYLLAFLYYHSTNNGQDVWRSCNPPGIAGSDGTNILDDIDEEDPDKCILYEFVRMPDDSIAYEPAIDRIRWMSNKFECEWEGVKCQGGDEVLGVEFFGQRLQGTLPTEIGALQFLQSISFPYNDLTGTIPADYGSLRHLLNLEVHGNLLTGKIPEEFFDQTGNSLVVFNVGDNLLSGSLSTGIGHLRDLKGLHIFENNLKGNFPTEIGKLGFLSYTRINGNEFTGPIPSHIGRLGQLSEFWWQDNLFSGTIPSELGRLNRLLQLRVNGNKLTGSIPDEIYGMSRLKRLDLQRMELTGTLSPLVGGMADLELLQVSRNKLTGQIPVEISQMANLKLAWLHLNLMTGSLPVEICSRVGPGLLEYLQTDCAPEDAPAVECLCCSSCCNRDTEVCLKVNS